MDAVLKKVGRALPILRWGRDYALDDLRHDAVAGLTVGVMLIPQGMAYAVLAGVPPLYGLFASLVPLLVYPVFGTSRHMAVGLTAVSMVVVAAGLGGMAEAGTAEYVGLAILLTLLVGAVEIGMGLARLGFLANLLSRPVITGFSTAAAFIIVASQLANLLGLELPRTQYVWEMVGHALDRLDAAHGLSLWLGLAGIVVVVVGQRWRPLVPSELAVVVAGTLAAWLFDLDRAGVAVVGEIPSGLPLPRLSGLDLGTVGELAPTAITLALVDFMIVVSLGRMFAARHRYSIDPNQELVAVGTANVFGSLFQSIPASGSFSRTSVNEQAGARTAASNVFAAALIGLTLLFLTPYFYYVPMPILASVIIVAGLGLVDLGEVRYLFTAKPSDGFIALFTFLATLGLGVQEGILLGIGAGVLAVLYRISRPHVAELGHLPATRFFKNLERFSEAVPIRNILLLRVEAGFSFFNAKFLKEFILRKADERGRDIRAVVIDGMSINFLDTTAVEVLEEVVETLDERAIEIHFAGLTGPVRDVIEDSGLGERVGPGQFHLSPYHAIVHILEKWDEAEGTRRLEVYEGSTRLDEEEVDPTSDSEFI